MSKRLKLVLSIILVVCILTGCAEMFDGTIFDASDTPQVSRNPFVPIEGTPVPEPNAPLLKTSEPTPNLTKAPSPSPSQSPSPTTAPSPTPTTVPTESPAPEPTIEPTPGPTPEPTIEPTPIPTPEPTVEPTPAPTLIPPVESIPKIGILTDDTDNSASALSSMAFSAFQQASLDYGYEPVFIELPAMDEGTILAHIDILVNDECELIILPSSRFKGALEKAQVMHPGTFFIMMEFDGILGDNVATVIFSEYQAGFLAGAAATIELSSGWGFQTLEFGVIIEENNLSAELYTAGFSEGINYAANLYDIEASLPGQFIYYLEFPGDTEESLYAAYSLYDSGAQCILNLAGTSASGIINGAIDARSWEIPSHVVGVDYDSYLEGIIEGDSSVVLTSAMKFYDSAVYRLISLYAAGEFPGGQNIMFDLSLDGVGLTPGNPGLSSDTVAALNEINSYIDSGILDIPPLGEYPIITPPPLP